MNSFSNARKLGLVLLISGFAFAPLSMALAQTQNTGNAALLGALLQAMNGNTRLALSCGLTLEAAWSRSAQVSVWKSRRDEKPAPPLGLPTVFCLGR